MTEGIDQPGNTGSTMECNICGSKAFVPMKGRGNVRCSGCGSLERTRVMALFIARLDLVKPTTRVLHIAPERGLAKRLVAVAGERCTLADVDPQRYRALGRVSRLDLCRDLEAIPARSYDLIIHSHVLEHLPCNHAYVLFHLHRILSDEGWVVCSIPFMGGYFDFATSPQIAPSERRRRFGQGNHFCRYGRADLDMSLGKLYKLRDYDLTREFDVQELDRYNIPDVARKGFTPHTVLCLRRDDYLLV